MSGASSFRRVTVLLTCEAPPSSRSSRSTMVMTTYLRPRLASPRATCSGSRPSTAPRGFPVVTAQKRQPRVHVSPRSITVAVPSVQHSPTFVQRASSHTVWRSSLRNVSLSRAYVSPPGARTLSHGGFWSEAEEADASGGFGGRSPPSVGFWSEAEEADASGGFGGRSPP